jgi:hypothetical protein
LSTPPGVHPGRPVEHLFAAHETQCANSERMCTQQMHAGGAAQDRVQSVPPPLCAAISDGLVPPLRLGVHVLLCCSLTVYSHVHADSGCRRSVSALPLEIPPSASQPLTTAGSTTSGPLQPAKHYRLRSSRPFCCEYIYLREEHCAHSHAPPQSRPCDCTCDGHWQGIRSL